MGVVNVACPYCGSETLATVPRNQELKKVTKSSTNIHHRSYSKAACKECGQNFNVAHK